MEPEAYDVVLPVLEWSLNCKRGLRVLILNASIGTEINNPRRMPMGADMSGFEFEIADVVEVVNAEKPGHVAHWVMSPTAFVQKLIENRLTDHSFDVVGGGLV